MPSRVVWGQGRRSSGKYVTSWSAVRAAVVAVAIRAFPPTHDMTSWRSWNVSRMNLLAAAPSFPPERLRGPGEREHGVEQHRGAPRAVLGRRPLRLVVAEAVLTRHVDHAGGIAVRHVFGVVAGAGPQAHRAEAPGLRGAGHRRDHLWRKRRHRTAPELHAPRLHPIRLLDGATGLIGGA